MTQLRVRGADEALPALGIFRAARAARGIAPVRDRIVDAHAEPGRTDLRRVLADEVVAQPETLVMARREDHIAHARILGELDPFVNAALLRLEVRHAVGKVLLRLEEVLVLEPLAQAVL